MTSTLEGNYDNLTEYIYFNGTFPTMKQRNCANFPKVTEERFILITLASVMAIFGIICNLMLIYTFLSRGERKETFLGYLAIFDWFICVSFIALFFNDTLANYYQIKFAYDALYGYVLIVLCVSKMAQLAIPLLLIAISLEKWAVLTNRMNNLWRHFHETKGRSFIATICTILAILGHLPTLWALTINTFASCEDYFLSKQVWPTKFYKTKFYTWYHLLCSSLQIFGSFFLILFLNMAVIFNLRKQRNLRQERLEEIGDSFIQKKYSTQAHCKRSATTLISLHQDVLVIANREQKEIQAFAVITSSYLICNSFHVLITCIEKWFPSLIYDELTTTWTTTYIISTDVINILFMISSAGRLLIHLAFNRKSLNPTAKDDELQEQICTVAIACTSRLAPEYTSFL